MSSLSFVCKSLELSVNNNKYIQLKNQKFSIVKKKPSTKLRSVFKEFNLRLKTFGNSDKKITDTKKTIAELKKVKTSSEQLFKSYEKKANTLWRRFLRSIFVLFFTKKFKLAHEANCKEFREFNKTLAGLQKKLALPEKKNESSKKSSSSSSSSSSSEDDQSELIAFKPPLAKTKLEGALEFLLRKIPSVGFVCNPPDILKLKGINELVSIRHDQLSAVHENVTKETDSFSYTGVVVKSTHSQANTKALVDSNIVKQAAEILDKSSSAEKELCFQFSGFDSVELSATDQLENVQIEGVQKAQLKGDNIEQQLKVLLRSEDIVEWDLRECTNVSSELIVALKQAPHVTKVLLPKSFTCDKTIRIDRDVIVSTKEDTKSDASLVIVLDSSVEDKDVQAVLKNCPKAWKLDLVNATDLSTDLIENLQSFSSLSRIHMPEDLKLGTTPLDRLPKFSNPIKVQQLYCASKIFKDAAKSYYTGLQEYAYLFQIPLLRKFNDASDLYLSNGSILDAESVYFWTKFENFNTIPPNNFIGTVNLDENKVDDLFTFASLYPLATRMHHKKDAFANSTDYSTLVQAKDDDYFQEENECFTLRPEQHTLSDIVEIIASEEDVQLETYDVGTTFFFSGNTAYKQKLDAEKVTTLVIDRQEPVNYAQVMSDLTKLDTIVCREGMVNKKFIEWIQSNKTYTSESCTEVNLISDENSQLILTKNQGSPETYTNTYLESEHKNKKIKAEDITTIIVDEKTNLVDLLIKFKNATYIIYVEDQVEQKEIDWVISPKSYNFVEKSEILIEEQGALTPQKALERYKRAQDVATQRFLRSFLELYGELDEETAKVPFDPQNMTDCTLKLKNKDIPFQKHIWASASKKIRDQLLIDRHETEISWEEDDVIDEDALKIFAQFLNTRKLPQLSIDEAIKVLSVETVYKMNTLRIECLKQLANKVTKSANLEDLAAIAIIGMGGRFHDDGIIASALKKLPKGTLPTDLITRWQQVDQDLNLFPAYDELIKYIRNHDVLTPDEIAVHNSRIN